jgi:hypothetical protein
MDSAAFMQGLKPPSPSEPGFFRSPFSPRGNDPGEAKNGNEIASGYFDDE